MTEPTTDERLDALIEVLSEHLAMKVGENVTLALRESVEQRALANRKPEPRVWYEVRSNDRWYGSAKNLDLAKEISESSVVPDILPLSIELWKFTRYPGKPPVVEIVEGTDHD